MSITSAQDLVGIFPALFTPILSDDPKRLRNSIDYKKVQPKGDVVFILGNEVEGVPNSILKKCDIVAEIPMAGMKESLNVSVAAGITLFRILDK